MPLKRGIFFYHLDSELCLTAYNPAATGQTLILRGLLRYNNVYFLRIGNDLVCILYYILL